MNGSEKIAQSNHSPSSLNPATECSLPSERLANAHTATVAKMTDAIKASGIQITGVENEDDLVLIPYLIGQRFLASEIRACLDEAIERVKAERIAA